jgi:hypothetical protein
LRARRGFTASALRSCTLQLKICTILRKIALQAGEHWRKIPGQDSSAESAANAAIGPT